ncbi:MAG: YdcF family protein [Clostridia bacterium]|nr:YdcF family protein [Clostridia bacterium]MBQ2254341.1 YdcF family protein [Clostridia bacterium]
MKKFWQTAWQKKSFRITFWCGVSFAAACTLFVLVCNLIVILTAYPHREDPEVLMDSKETYDCILVLGAGIKADGTLSNLLRDRMTMGIRLAEKGKAPVLLLTGDGEDPQTYDEVGAMAAYAMENGIDEALILKDPLGLSTYESLWRAKYVYGMEKVLIVTQNFHLDRALYLADRLGLECTGVECDITMALPMNHIREFAARIKALYQGLTLPELDAQKG